MIAVGIDVSKSKSTVAILDSYGTVLATPFNMAHTQPEMNALVSRLKAFDEPVTILLEYTGHYHYPVLKKLQVDTVGSVTRPVTQVAVVAVNNASRYGTASPVAELMGSAKRQLPSKIAITKLNKMICVVDKANFFLRIIRYSPKKRKGTNILCRQLVPFVSFHF